MLQYLVMEFKQKFINHHNQILCWDMLNLFFSKEINPIKSVTKEVFEQKMKFFDNSQIEISQLSKGTDYSSISNNTEINFEKNQKDFKGGQVIQKLMTNVPKKFTNKKKFSLRLLNLNFSNFNN